MSFTDPRIAALYDLDNPDGPDHDFFRAHAALHHARQIIDLGCGTGMLTVTLAGPGRTVTGIDPASAMLDIARARAGGGAVEWVLGGSDRLAGRSADFIVMSGNVSMHILRDEWHTTLAAIATALLPGGRLVFESRNPAREAWRAWNMTPTNRDTPHGPLRESMTTDAPDADGIVEMHCHNEFLVSGDVVDVDQELQFRSAEQIERDLARVGLHVMNVWRDWHRTPFTGGADEALMVFDCVRDV